MEVQGALEGGGGMGSGKRAGSDLAQGMDAPIGTAGAGVIYTNARNWSDQDAIGANVEFTPQFAGGLRFLLEKNWTFNIEGSFQHISNANTSARNQGVNAYGGFVGFTYVFDKIWTD